MKNSNKKFSNTKAAIVGSFCGVDRGGIKPQELGDKPTPETIRTRPSCPQNYSWHVFVENARAPLRELLGSRTISFGAGLSPLQRRVHLYVFFVKNYICNYFKHFAFCIAFFTFSFLLFIFASFIPYAQAATVPLGGACTIADTCAQGSCMLYIGATNSCRAVTSADRGTCETASTCGKTCKPIPGIEFLTTLNTCSTPGDLLSAVYVFALSMVGISALIMLTLGGVKYMLAGDRDPSSAKEMMKNAFIGLIIAFVAWLILYTINPDLVKTLELNLSPIGTPTASTNTPNLPPGTPPSPITGTATQGSQCVGVSTNPSQMCVSGLTCLTNFTDAASCRSANGNESGVCQTACPQAPVALQLGVACDTSSQCDSSAALECRQLVLNNSGIQQQCRTATAALGSGRCLPTNCKANGVNKCFGDDNCATGLTCTAGTCASAPPPPPPPPGKAIGSACVAADTCTGGSCKVNFSDPATCREAFGSQSGICQTDCPPPPPPTTGPGGFVPQGSSCTSPSQCDSLSGLNCRVIRTTGCPFAPTGATGNCLDSSCN